MAGFEAQFATPTMYLLSADGKRNERIWSSYGNYENNRKGRGKLVRGFPVFLSNLPDEKDTILIFVRSFARRDGAGRGGIYELELDSGDVRESSKVPEFTQQALSTKDGTTLVVSSWDSEYNQKHFICRNNLDWEPLELTLSNFAKDFVPFKVVGDFVYAKAQSSSPVMHLLT